jgi:hypothetical protein
MVFCFFGRVLGMEDLEIGLWTEKMGMLGMMGLFDFE